MKSFLGFGSSGSKANSGTNTDSKPLDDEQMKQLLKGRNNRGYAYSDREINAVNYAMNMKDGYNFHTDDATGESTSILVKGLELLNHAGKIVVEMPACDAAGRDSPIAGHLKIQFKALDSLKTEGGPDYSFKILFPYKTIGWHWNCGEIIVDRSDPEKIRIQGRAYDSFGRGRLAPQIQAEIKNFFLGHYKHPVPEFHLDQESSTPPIQQGGIACGLYAARFMHNLKTGDNSWPEARGKNEQTLRDEDSEFILKHNKSAVSKFCAPLDEAKYKDVSSLNRGAYEEEGENASKILKRIREIKDSCLTTAELERKFLIAMQEMANAPEEKIREKYNDAFEAFGKINKELCDIFFSKKNGERGDAKFTAESLRLVIDRYCSLEKNSDQDSEEKDISEQPNSSPNTEESQDKNKADQNSFIEILKLKIESREMRDKVLGALESASAAFNSQDANYRDIYNNLFEELCNSSVVIAGIFFEINDSYQRGNSRVDIESYENVIEEISKQDKFYPKQTEEAQEQTTEEQKFEQCTNFIHTTFTDSFRSLLRRCDNMENYSDEINGFFNDSEAFFLSILEEGGADSAKNILTQVGGLIVEEIKKEKIKKSELLFNLDPDNYTMAEDGLLKTKKEVQKSISLEDIEKKLSEIREKKQRLMIQRYILNLENKALESPLDKDISKMTSETESKKRLKPVTKSSFDNLSGEWQSKILNSTKIRITEEELVHARNFLALVALTDGEGVLKQQKIQHEFEESKGQDEKPIVQKITQEEVYQKQGILPSDISGKLIEDVAKEITADNIKNFYKRLVEKRSLTFSSEESIDREGNKMDDGGCLGGKDPENYLLYSEMELGAMLGISGYTQFINNGGQNNLGNQSQPDDHEKFGRITALSRLVKNRSEIEWASDDFFKGYEKIYTEFYKLNQLEDFSSDEDIVKYCEAQILEHRLYFSYKKLFADAISEDNLTGGKKAYIRIVGLGDESETDPDIRPVIGRAVRKVFDELGEDLQSQIKAIEFCEDNGLKCFQNFIKKDEVLENENGVNLLNNVHIITGNDVKFSNKLADKYSDCQLSINFASNAGSYVGNDYWNDDSRRQSSEMSREADAAYCSSIAISMNPDLNPEFLDRIEVIEKGSFEILLLEDAFAEQEKVKQPPKPKPKPKSEPKPKPKPTTEVNKELSKSEESEITKEEKQKFLKSEADNFICVQKFTYKKDPEDTKSLASLEVLAGFTKSVKEAKASTKRDGALLRIIDKLKNSLKRSSNEEIWKDLTTADKNAMIEEYNKKQTDSGNKISDDDKKALIDYRVLKTKNFKGVIEKKELNSPSEDQKAKLEEVMEFAEGNFGLSDQEIDDMKERVVNAKQNQNKNHDSLGEQVNQKNEELTNKVKEASAKKLEEIRTRHSNSRGG